MRLLDHLKIIWKISLIVAVLGATLAGVVVFGTDQLSTTVADFAELSNQQMSSIAVVRAQRRLETYHAALYALLTETTAEGNEKRLKLAVKNRDEIASFMDLASKEDPAQTKQIDGFKADLTRAFAVCDPVLEAGAKAVSPEENAKVADRAHQECDPAIDGVLGKLQTFVGQIVELTRKKNEAIRAEADSSTRAVMLVGIVGLIIGVAIALFIGLRSLSAPIARLKAAMERLANNDLTVEVPETERRDELGDMAKTVQVFKTNGI